MRAIVESNAMRATMTRYSVAGWGEGELWMLGRVVLAHDFSYLESRGDDRSGEREGRTVGTDPRSHAENGLDEGTAGEDLADRLANYLAGADVRLDDVELDLSWTTPFQHAVADALRRIPRGEIATYGELAALAGYPGAARAVGSFCAHNRFALLVPCHRVVGAGGLGGYGATGPAVKRRLLALEGVEL